MEAMHPMITGDRPVTPADIDTRIQAIDARPDAPESWHPNRCGTKGCDQFGTHRVDMPESWYLMCEAHAAEHIPPATFDPSGDGTYRVRCVDCRETVASDQAHIVKATNPIGRANRCNGCGEVAHRDIWLFNHRDQTRVAALRVVTEPADGAL